MTGKSGSLYFVIGLAGIALLFLSKKYQDQVDAEANDQIQAIQTRINKPRPKIDIKADPIQSKIEVAMERAEQIKQPDILAKRKSAVTKIANERKSFLKRHGLSFPPDPLSTYIVKTNEMMEVGRSGSYTIGVFVFKNVRAKSIKDEILKKLNVPSDELKTVAFQPNAANGFRNQAFYEAESQGLYHMFFLANHPRNGNTIVMHFTIQSMSRVVEQYILKRYKTLRAI